MELRIHGERAVLAGPGGNGAREIDPRNVAIGAELADALHEWARVASAVRRAGQPVDPASDGGAPESGPNPEAARVVSQRGRQLATRVAAVMGTPVHYLDPVTDTRVVVAPPREQTARRKPSAFARFIGTPEQGTESTPWLPGLTIAAIFAVVVVVAMLALAGTLARQTSGWLAIVASVVVTGGLAPSLWLGRKLPILRWLALGSAVGLVLAWVGVLSL